MPLPAERTICTTERPERVGPIGVRIYHRSGGEGDLTMEHVMPRGLGGGLILLAASCARCSKITMGIEQRVLRFGQMRVARAALNLSGKEERPTTAPLLVVQDGKERLVDVALEDHPRHLGLPVFPAPGYLEERQFPTATTNFDFIAFNPILEKTLARWGMRLVQMLSFSPATVQSSKPRVPSPSKP